jgi:hypothetical protein
VILAMRALVCFFLMIGSALAAEPEVMLEESFTSELSKDWFWGLGTWKAENGILRGFESGPRRHGPVKMRRLALHDAVIECEFRLEGKATFAGIIFNGSQERGHLLHLVMSKDQLRILAHPKKGETKELLQVPAILKSGAWHKVHLTFQGPKITAFVDGVSINAEHACIAEEKLTFGLGGDSGGPEGEKAGALEFRGLVVKAP